jgi:hypothetical protein
VWLEKRGLVIKGAIKYQGFDCTLASQSLRIVCVTNFLKVYSHQLSVILNIIRGKIRIYSKGSNNGYISRVDLSTRKKYFYTSSFSPKQGFCHRFFVLLDFADHVLIVATPSIDWLAGWGERKLDGDLISGKPFYRSYLDFLRPTPQRFCKKITKVFIVSIFASIQLLLTSD